MQRQPFANAKHRDNAQLPETFPIIKSASKDFSSVRKRKDRAANQDLRVRHAWPVSCQPLLLLASCYSLAIHSKAKHAQTGVGATKMSLREARSMSEGHPKFEGCPRVTRTAGMSETTQTWLAHCAGPGFAGTGEATCTSCEGAA